MDATYIHDYFKIAIDIKITKKTIKILIVSCLFAKRGRGAISENRNLNFLSTVSWVKNPIYPDILSSKNYHVVVAQ